MSINERHPHWLRSGESREHEFSNPKSRPERLVRILIITSIVMMCVVVPGLAALGIVFIWDSQEAVSVGSLVSAKKTIDTVKTKSRILKDGVRKTATDLQKHTKEKIDNTIAEITVPITWIKKFPSGTSSRTRPVIISTSESEIEDTTVEALLRICTSEQEDSRDDCIGIWQVLTNIRSRSCNYSMIKNITECDNNGETMLSAIRRGNRYISGLAEPRTKRQRWLSHMKISCDMPRFYPYGRRTWESYNKPHCMETVKLARKLVRGEIGSLTESLIIAWGGRCETVEGACDDRFACQRGLVRALNLETANAFWCRPGTYKCPTGVKGSGIDPVCIRLGYKKAPK